MGTLCKNCPCKNTHKESGEACTVAFAKKYGNSCVNLNIEDIKPTEEKKTTKKAASNGKKTSKKE